MATLTVPTATREFHCAWDWPVRQTVEDARRQVRRVMTDMRHNAEDATADAALRIRRHPLAAVGLAACVGTIAGALVGFSLGWTVNARR